MLSVKSAHAEFRMTPGQWRSAPEHDVAVGRHIPPSSRSVEPFMAHFERRYRFEGAVRRRASWPWRPRITG